MIALAGGATHNLSGMGLLPAAGTIGMLITGEPSAESLSVLGQWRIGGAVAVSEPSTLGMAATALLGFVVLRRRRQRV